MITNKTKRPSLNLWKTNQATHEEVKATSNITKNTLDVFQNASRAY